MDLVVYLPLVTLVIGGVIGFLTNVYFKSYEARQKTTEKVLDQFFQARRELVVELSKLATLKDRAYPNSHALSAIRHRISQVYFLNYDFLPKEVLDELNCLFVCLTDHSNRIFRVVDGRVLPLKPSDYVRFVEQISLVENFEYSAILDLRSDDIVVRRAVSIQCQARKVLKALNEHFTMHHLMNWINSSTKTRRRG